MKKFLAKKISELLNATEKTNNNGVAVVNKWFTGSVEVPQDAKQQLYKK